VTALPSRCWQAHDVAAELCWKWHCCIDVGHGVMPLLSHADDVLLRRGWPWRDVATDSCWSWAAEPTLVVA
jgi:hypothetical protein